MTKKKVQYGELARTVLGVVAVSGILAMALVAPGLAKASLLFASRPRAEHRRTSNRVLRRLQNRGLITIFIRSDGKEYVKLTEKGRQELLRYEWGLKRLAQKKWDNYWRLVIFDVKEEQRHLRARLYRMLRSFEFVRLQDSVWIYPFACEEIIELMRSMLRLRGEVLYITSQRFFGDEWLRKNFFEKKTV